MNLRGLERQEELEQREERLEILQIQCTHIGISKINKYKERTHVRVTKAWE